MTKIIRTGIAVAAMLIAPIAAQAADLSSPRYNAPAYSAPAYSSWTGFYVGLNGGYGFGKSNWTDPTLVVATGDFNVNGGLFGGTLGYNLQTGTWVWGLEGDFDLSTVKGSAGTAVCVPDCETKNNWLATARGRLGYGGFYNWLPYLTGGAAFGDIKATQGAASVTTTKLGWAVGAGVEYAFMGNWSAKVEYLYADLGKANCPTVTCGADIDVKFNTNIVRLGVNYRF
jgi:outer membrane immunogenic protein